MSILKNCKKHGPLEEKDCQQRIKLGKYIEISCKLCGKEKRDNVSTEKKLAIKERKRAHYDRTKLKEREPRICKKHGIIGPELQSVAHFCLLCQKDNYSKRRHIYLDREKQRREERIKNRPSSLICPTHGLVNDENIDKIGKCRLCNNEYQKQYSLKNRF